MTNLWFVRAGSGGSLINEFIGMDRMAIGLRGTQDFREFEDLDSVRNHILNTPKFKDPKSNYGTGMAKYGVQFFAEVEIDDLVLLANGNDLLTAAGIVNRENGEYEFIDDPGWSDGQPDYCHIRGVDWSEFEPEIMVGGLPRQRGFGRISKNQISPILTQILDHTTFEPDSELAVHFRQFINWADGNTENINPDGERGDDNFAYFGEVFDIPIGATFQNRRDLYDANVHRALQAGIVGREDTGAESVVLSGGYVDDEDYGDFIIYTGQGGQDNQHRQTADQEFIGRNKALVRNCLDDTPVRVIRGSGHISEHAPTTGYRYDGLFKVESYWRKKGEHGFFVCRFRLVRLAEQEVDLPLSNIDEENTVRPPTPRTETTVNRLVRDRNLANSIKEIHNYHCQVCGTQLEVEGGFYAEAAHIKPLGRPHDGPDTLVNLLCLCPNHHVAFDNGSLFVKDDLTILNTNDRLRTIRGHEPATEFFSYHRSIWGKD